MDKTQEINLIDIAETRLSEFLLKGKDKGASENYYVIEVKGFILANSKKAILPYDVCITLKDVLGNECSFYLPKEGNLSGVLKDFFTTQKFITDDVTHLYNIFLFYRVHINIVWETMSFFSIKYGVYTLDKYNTKVERIPLELREAGVLKLYKDWGTLTDISDVLKVRKMIAYTGYFSTFVDLDKDLVNTKRDEIDDKILDLDKKSGIRGFNYIETLKRFKELGIVIEELPLGVRKMINSSTSIAYLKREYPYLREFFLVLEEKKKLKRAANTLRRVLKPWDNLNFPKMRRNGLFTQNYPIYYSELKGMYKLDESKYYYVRLDAFSAIYKATYKELYNKYKEYNEHDFMRVVAKVLYNKGYNDITKEERTIVTYLVWTSMELVQELILDQLCARVRPYKDLVEKVNSLGIPSITSSDDSVALKGVNNTILFGCISKLYDLLRSYKGEQVQPAFIGEDTIILRVNNNINPYQLISDLYNHLDTYEEHGFDYYLSAAVANDLHDLGDITANFDFDNLSRINITRAFVRTQIMEGNLNKLTNVVKDVEKHIEEYKAK
ncbi:hypothetical protein D3C81_11580 [compost metagenome]